MPTFKEFINGFEEKPEAKNTNHAPTPKPQEVKMEQPKPQSKDNYVIFKENGQFRGTPRSNYNAKVRDANKIQDYDDFTSHEQIRDYLMKYGKDKNPDDYEFEDYEAPKNEWENDAELEKTPYNSIKDYKGQSITQETGGYMVSTDKGDYLFNSVAEAKEFINKNQPQQPKQPKEGSFEQAFGDMSKPEQGLGDFNPSERIEEYNDSHGAKTHSEREFNVYAGNDRGMYDYIRKNRDYLYRKANSDPQGAIADILAHSKSGASHIKPENIRKDYAMEVLKDFYEENGEKAPDLTQPEEFKPTEKIEEFNDYYGAKTASERELNLLTGNDRGAYEYVTQNRDALAKEAEYDPASVLNKIKWHADNRDMARALKGDSIRKDYLINVIKGIIED